MKQRLSKHHTMGNEDNEMSLMIVQLHSCKSACSNSEKKTQAVPGNIPNGRQS